MTFTIRTACEADAPALLAIYRPYVENTAISFEHTAPSVDEFTNRIRNTLAKFPYLVLEQNQEILGYCYAGIFKARAAYNHCVETSIYIRQDKRGQGLGRILYTELEKQLKARGTLNAYACIASPKDGSTKLDNSSQKFHEKMGYTLVGTFHDCGYKFGQWYNMIWMEKFLGTHEIAL